MGNVNTFKAYVDENMATKGDIRRVEGKIDELLELMGGGAVPQAGAPHEAP